MTKEIQNISTLLNTTSNFKTVGNETCDGCKMEVEIVEGPIIGGPRKGQIETFRKGCKCEEIQLAKEALEAEERAKKAQAQEIFETKSIINRRLKQCTFKNYKPRNETQQKGLEWAVNYCKTFDPTKSPNAILRGTYGLGKSHLSVSIVKYLINIKGYTAIFISVPKLMTKIKATYNNDDQSEETLLDALEIVDFLVLDDLGAEMATPWQLTKLFEVIDARAGKPTVYTTNYDRKGLISKIGARNFDRLMENTEQITFEGESYRLNHIKGE